MREWSPGWSFGMIVGNGGAVRLDEDECRARFAAARVARLATKGADGGPHLVPIVFALAGQRVVTAVDAKPKSTAALRRLENIAAHPSVALLVDRYDDDWSRLWWVRADGRAAVVDGSEAARGIALLTDRYPQYETQPPPGPVVAIDVARWSGWAAVR